MLWSRIRTVRNISNDGIFPSRQRYSQLSSATASSNSLRSSRHGSHRQIRFVASAHPTRGVDTSHRGAILALSEFDNRMLRIPDYSGNSMFNTLGNFAVNSCWTGFLILLAAALTTDWSKPFSGIWTIQSIQLVVLIVTGTLRSRSGWRQICSSLCTGSF